MKTNPDVQLRSFDVHIPNLEGDGTAETITIQVPVRIDPVTGDEILTPEALAQIEKTKARRMGLMSPDEIRDLRDRLDLTQQEMSELLQIGAKTYTRWEAGRARVSRSMNLLLCALRDGRIDVNYLKAIRDPDFCVDWFTQNRSQSFFMSCVGAVQPSQEVDFMRELEDRAKAWLARSDFISGNLDADIIVHMGADYPNTPWLFTECKHDETLEMKSIMPRTMSPRLPESQSPWKGFRRSICDSRSAEEQISS